MDSEKIKTEIDNDAGLHSKRKLLIVVSAILLALSFSGAKIEEANTFIFNIKFTNQNGLGNLFVLSIIFLMIRYYNYASSYHKKIFSVWTTRLLKHPFFYHADQFYHGDEGLVANARPTEIEELLSGVHSNSQLKNWNFTYQCGIFSRKIVYSWSYIFIEKQCEIFEEATISIYHYYGFKTYLMTLVLEFKERMGSLFMHRENLDIYSPYMLGTLAITSYYLNTELIYLLNFLTP